MTSLLILLLLSGMWAFVLIPLVRHRNVRVDEIRSVARFSSALRVLSRNHRPSGHPGMRQWVMPPRSGVGRVSSADRGSGTVGRGVTAGASRAGASLGGAGASRARVGGAGAGRAGVGRAGVSRSGAPAARAGAALRRRRFLEVLAAMVVLTLLLVALEGRSLLVLQVVADVAAVAGLAACRWSVQQERAARRRRARRARLAGRGPIQAVTDRGHDGYSVEVEAHPRTPVRSARGVGHGNASPAVMTVPLDAPLPSRRAVPSQGVIEGDPDTWASRVSAGPRVAVASGVAAGSRAGGARAAASHTGVAVSDDRTGGGAAARPPRPRRPVEAPQAEPVVLAEIDLDWEPFVSEPASGVRIIDLGNGNPPRRKRLFDDTGADGVDIGDDADLDAIVQRRVSASGW